jgi:hypothetical protein
VIARCDCEVCDCGVCDGGVCDVWGMGHVSAGWGV